VKLRSALYRTARIMGDVQAVSRAVETGSGRPVARRAKRRLLGRLAGRIIAKL
jgi:hypothetical protein